MLSYVIMTLKNSHQNLPHKILTLKTVDLCYYYTDMAKKWTYVIITLHGLHVMP